MSDDESFAAAYREHYWAVSRYVARRLDGRSSDVEEVVAEVFTVAWRRRNDLPAIPLPWLYGVARHCLANAVRGYGRRRRLLDRIGNDESAHGKHVVQGPDAGSPADWVHEALARLAPSDQEVLRLTAWEELGVDEIAVALGCGSRAAAMRLHRARRRLAAEIDGLRISVAAAPRRPAATPRRKTAMADELDLLRRANPVPADDPRFHDRPLDPRAEHRLQVLTRTGRAQPARTGRRPRLGPLLDALRPRRPRDWAWTVTAAAAVGAVVLALTLSGPATVPAVAAPRPLVVETGSAPLPLDVLADRAAAQGARRGLRQGTHVQTWSLSMTSGPGARPPVTLPEERVVRWAADDSHTELVVATDPSHPGKPVVTDADPVPRTVEDGHVISRRTYPPSWSDAPPSARPRTTHGGCVPTWRRSTASTPWIPVASSTPSARCWTTGRSVAGRPPPSPASSPTPRTCAPSEPSPTGWAAPDRRTSTRTGPTRSAGCSFWTRRPERSSAWRTPSPGATPSGA